MEILILDINKLALIYLGQRIFTPDVKIATPWTQDVIFNGDLTMSDANDLEVDLAMEAMDYPATLRGIARNLIQLNTSCMV